MSNETRQPAGTPTGGQFATTSRNDTGLELTPPMRACFSNGSAFATIDQAPDGSVTAELVATSPDTGEVFSEVTTEHLSVQDAALWVEAVERSDDFTFPTGVAEPWMRVPTGVVQVPLGEAGHATIQPFNEQWSMWKVEAIATDPDSGSVLSESHTFHATRQDAITATETMRHAPEWDPHQQS